MIKANKELRIIDRYNEKIVVYMVGERSNHDEVEEVTHGGMIRSENVRMSNK